MSALLLPLAFAFGLVVGALLTVAQLVRRMRNPAVAQRLLRRLYAQAHGHWLQRTRDDATPVCPCCGWSGPAVPAAASARDDAPATT
jgi:uncharacterized protein YneF (UPF0154 family)